VAMTFKTHALIAAGRGKAGHGRAGLGAARQGAWVEMTSKPTQFFPPPPPSHRIPPIFSIVEQLS